MNPARKRILLIALFLLFLLIPVIYITVKNHHPKIITDSQWGSEMILIPGGKYLVGSGKSKESPRREVSLESFYMDKYPVTRGQFKSFLNSVHGEWRKDIRKSRVYDEILASDLPDDLPITGVYYREAEQYAQWVGKRLPTEVEWEAGAGGKEGLLYTWGNSWDEGRIKAEMKCRKAGEQPGAISSTGIEDLTGNIFHLTCTGCVVEAGEMDNSPERRGNLHIVKAGALAYMPSYNGNGFRCVLSENVESPFVGFRCVKPLNPRNDVNLKRFGNIEKALDKNSYENSEAIRLIFAFELRPGRALHPIVMNYLNRIKPGTTVADVGCRLGFLTRLLSEKVGKGGKVFAVDKDESVLDFIKAVDSREKYNNIVTVHSRMEDVSLPENSCDEIWLMGSIGLLSPQDRKGFVNSCLKALKKNGVMVVIDEDPDKSGQVRSVLEIMDKSGGFLLKDHLSLKSAKFRGYEYDSNYSFLRVYGKK